MLPKQLYGRRLRSLIAGFLGKGHARAHGQAGKTIVEHAVAMEIDFFSVAGLEEAELAGRIEPHDRSNRRALVMLHLASGAANLILELSARVLESIIESEGQVGMPLVLGRGTLYVHLAAVGKRETDVDLIQSALAVMLTGRFEHDPARCYAAPELFELRHVRRDGVFDVRGPGHALKLDFRQRLHLLLPLVRHKRPGTTASKLSSLYLSLSGRREKEEFALLGFAPRQYRDGSSRSHKT